MFAQEWQFNGELRAGLGMFITEGADDPYVRTVSEAGGGVRSDLRTRVQNAEGTAGLDMLFRAQGGATTNNVFMPHGFGWINFMDNMLTLQGGRIDDAAGFNSFDRLANTRMGEGTGLRMLIRPMDGLVFNLGAFVPEGGGHVWFDYDDSTAAQVRTVFAFSYTEPDLFRIVGGLRTANEAGGPADGFHGWMGGHGATAVTNRSIASAAYFSFEYLGLNSDGMHLSASAFFLNLEEFGDYGAMFYYASFGHTGLVDGMDLRLNAGFGMSQRDAHEDFHLHIWASVDYQLSDMVVPRLDLHYVMGGLGGSMDGDFHHRDPARGATFNSDHSFVRIQPSVQFRVQANTFVELGCIFHIDLSDHPIPSGTWNEDGANIAVYALMRVSF